MDKTITKKSRLFSRKYRRCAAVIAAAGRSERMGGINKIFAEISGIPVIVRTVKAFQECGRVDDIVIVAREEDAETVQKLCAEYGFTKVRSIVFGGETRAESAFSGVAAAPKKCGLIAIHDAARPFVSDKIIRDAVDAAEKYGAAAPAIPVKDTIKTVKRDVVLSTPDRSSLRAVQTPQVFDRALITAALADAIKGNAEITDDCSAVERIGAAVHITEGSYCNIKITTPEDIVFGGAISSMEE